MSSVICLDYLMVMDKFKVDLDQMFTSLSDIFGMHVTLFAPYMNMYSTDCDVSYTHCKSIICFAHSFHGAFCVLEPLRFGDCGALWSIFGTN